MKSDKASDIISLFIFFARTIRLFTFNIWIENYRSQDKDPLNVEDLCKAKYDNDLRIWFNWRMH
mgnify:CR=1 FL=1